MGATVLWTMTPTNKVSIPYYEIDEVDSIR